MRAPRLVTVKCIDYSASPKVRSTDTYDDKESTFTRDFISSPLDLIQFRPGHRFGKRYPTGIFYRTGKQLLSIDFCLLC